MKHNEFENLTLGVMEDAIEEYENIKDKLIELQKTNYIGTDFLLDELMDEYMDDIDEMQEILNEAENGCVPSAYEDYYDNVITPTMRGLR
jgi:hypothetical protein